MMEQADMWNLKFHAEWRKGANPFIRTMNYIANNSERLSKE